MTEHRHPVDDLLRAYAGTPEPDSEDRNNAEARLIAAIDLAAAAQAPQRRRWPVAVWATVLLTVVVGLLFVLEAGRSSPVSAAMEEIARIAETTEPLTVSDTEFVYTRSEMQAIFIVPKEGLGDVPYTGDHLVYLALSTRETWFGTRGTVQIRTTFHEPVFFTAVDESVYYAAGIDKQDQIGETITTTVTDPTKQVWPTDPVELDSAIREAMVTERGLPETVEYLDVALDILRESFSSPQLRAATLRLIGDINGLQLVETSAAQSVTFLIEYVDRNVDARLTFTIDMIGNLSFEEHLNLTADQEFGIPADTSVFVVEYSAPLVVDGLDAR